MQTNGLCLVVVVVVLGFLTGQSSSSHDAVFFSRWRRQAVHCQPGDDTCQKCSSGCHALASSQLPECCEAYNTCCDEYFQACKSCSNSLTKDPYFPEYCCASFTSCCDLITTFTTDVKPPTPVRTKPKSDLKIPEVAAPKPTFFPGAGQSPLKQSNLSPEPAFPREGPLPSESVFSSQKPSPSENQPVQVQPEAAFKPSALAGGRRPTAGSNPVGGAEDDFPAIVDNSQRQRDRTQARAQVRPAARGRQQAARSQRKGGVDLESRRGRITSRGRVSK
ncbi:uncharacterized protein LOC135201459 [Macrobrachium nipponense]|uniref:uncharacterized protein LOC135201459 n=1 Tax=Macrobrachium nipponense TaxID=159736 RepID=UPI0030C7B092